MTISQAYALATDGEFRLLAGFTSPPRAGVVSALEGSGQVRVVMDDADGVDVLAWPLNGFTYAVNDLVYVVFAADSPESGIVVGSKGTVPVLGGVVRLTGDQTVAGIKTFTSALIAQGTLLVERLLGATISGFRTAASLKATTTGSAADGMGPFLDFILADAETPAGTNLARMGAVRNGADNTGDFVIATINAGVEGEKLRVAASGKVGIGTSAPAEMLDVYLPTASPRINARRGDGATCQMIAGASVGVFGTGSNHDLTLYANAVEKARVTTTGRLGVGVTVPQGMVHAHNGVGGMLATTVGGISSTTPIVIIPNAAGDVVRGLAGQVVVTDGAATAANTFAMLPGETLDVAVGSLTVRFTVTATGQVDVRRQSGTGTAVVALLVVWL